MKWISAIALSLSLWGWGTTIAASPSLRTSFREWCLQRTSLSASSQKTVEVLLEQTGTSDCSQADEILSSRTELDLYAKEITDVRPLSGLTNLTGLLLKDNPIAQPTCPVTSPGVCRF